MAWGTNEKLNQISKQITNVQTTVNGLTQVEESEYTQAKKEFEKLIKDVEEIKSTVNQILALIQGMQPGPAVSFSATVSKP